MASVSRWTRLPRLRRLEGSPPHRRARGCRWRSARVRHGGHPGLPAPTGPCSPHGVVPPDFMVRDRAAVRVEQERLAEAVAAVRAELTVKEATDVSHGPARSALGRLNIVRNMREGRGRRQAATEKATIEGKSAAVVAELARAQAKRTGIDHAIMAESAAGERRFSREAARAELIPIIPQVAALSLFTLAFLHSAAAFLAPGSLMHPPMMSPTLIRGGH